MNERRLDLGLKAIRAERTTYPDAADVRREVLAIPLEEIPRRRSWLPLTGGGPFRPLVKAPGVAVAAVIAAFTGGLLLGGLLMTSQDERASVGASPSDAAIVEPSPAPSIGHSEPTPLVVLPDEIPDGLATGTIETPAGVARWVYRSVPCCDDPRMPGHGKVLPWGSGIAVQPIWSKQFYMTSDGVDWEMTTLPVARRESFSIDYVAGTYVLVGSTGAAWTSTDGTAWLQLDTSPVEAVWPEGWERQGISVEVGPHLFDDRIVVGIKHSYVLPRNQLGIVIGDGTRALYREPGGPMRYGLSYPNDEGETEGIWQLRFRETERGLRVIDVKTGESLGLLEGAKASELYEGEEGETLTFFEIAGDRLVPIELPWPGVWPTDQNRYEASPESEPPPGLPAGAVVEYVGPGWFASAKGDPGGWLEVDGEWVSLESMSLESDPETKLGAPQRLANVVLWWGPFGGSPVSLWVLTLPADE